MKALFLALLVAALAVACATPVPTPIPTPTPNIPATVTARMAAIPTATPYPTLTPWPTATPRPTLTPWPTPTAVPTATPYPTNTPYPTPTPQPTYTPTYKLVTPTLMPTPTIAPNRFVIDQPRSFYQVRILRDWTKSLDSPGSWEYADVVAYNGSDVSGLNISTYDWIDGPSVNIETLTDLSIREYPALYEAAGAPAPLIELVSVADKGQEKRVSLRVIHVGNYCDEEHFMRLLAKGRRSYVVTAWRCLNQPFVPSRLELQQVLEGFEVVP